MNYRMPSKDILAGTKVTFYISTKVKNSDVYLILIDAYTFRKMRLKMDKHLLNTLTLPFNEAGKYYYYFEFENEDQIIQYDERGIKENAVIHPFTLVVYKENYLTIETFEKQLYFGTI